MSPCHCEASQVNQSRKVAWCHLCKEHRSARPHFKAIGLEKCGGWRMGWRSKVFWGFFIKDAWIMVNWSFDEELVWYLYVCISLEPNPSFEAKMGWEDMRSGSLHIIAEYSILEHSCRTHAGRGHHRDCMAAVYSRNDHGSCLRHFTALCSGGQFSLCLVSWVWTGAVATTRATWLKQNHRLQNGHNRCGISVRLFDKIVSVVFSLFSKLRWLYLIVTLMIRCDVNDSNMIICRM